MAGISESAAREFAGFAEATKAQGLNGATVVACKLAGEGAPGPRHRQARQRSPEDPPLVVSVGTLEPRKNHLALLFASEVLWREGLRFEVRLIAGSQTSDDVHRRVSELQASGRSVSIRSRVSQSELAEAYESARFTVFASLHEGFGLPVVESLAVGTPVITSDFASTAELAEDGGTVLVDPRDDDALVEAMRSLLTDDYRLEALRSQARSRPVTTWETYASRLWDVLVTPELDALAGEGYT